MYCLSYWLCGNARLSEKTSWITFRLLKFDTLIAQTRPIERFGVHLRFSSVVQDRTSNSTILSDFCLTSDMSQTWLRHCWSWNNWLPKWIEYTIQVNRQWVSWSHLLRHSLGVQKQWDNGFEPRLEHGTWIREFLSPLVISLVVIICRPPRIWGFCHGLTLMNFNYCWRIL